MAFVAEDGTGLANANALCSVEFAKSYFTDRGVQAWLNADTAAQRQALVRASDYVEGRWAGRFRGDKQYPDVQALSFPRLDINADNMVPVGVQKAVAEYALRALTAALAPDQKVDATGVQVAGTVKKVGPIETSVTYMPGTGVRQFQPYPAADMLLRPFVRAGGGTVYR